MKILTQLGEFLLASIPTIICLLVVWVAYRNIVQRKLERVLEKRRALTAGLLEKAQADIGKAEELTTQYEQRLREARSQIYKGQEARRRHIMEKRSAALTDAHRHADELVQHARTRLDNDMNEARAMLDRQADSLAAQIIDSILKPLAATGGR